MLWKPSEAGRPGKGPRPSPHSLHGLNFIARKLRLNNTLPSLETLRFQSRASCARADFDGTYSIGLNPITGDQRN